MRVLRAIGGVFGEEQERPALVWTREVDLAGRDRALDWLMVGELPEGEVQVTVRVWDLNSGASAATERAVGVGVEPQE